MIFFLKFSLPEDIVTEYMCHMFDVPTDWYDHKRHVIRVSYLNLKGDTNCSTCFLVYL